MIRAILPRLVSEIELELVIPLPWHQCCLQQPASGNRLDHSVELSHRIHALSPHFPYLPVGRLILALCFPPWMTTLLTRISPFLKALRGILEARYCRYESIRVEVEKRDGFNTLNCLGKTCRVVGQGKRQRAKIVCPIIFELDSHIQALLKQRINNRFYGRPTSAKPLGLQLLREFPCHVTLMNRDKRSCNDRQYRSNCLYPSGNGLILRGIKAKENHKYVAAGCQQDDDSGNDRDPTPSFVPLHTRPSVFSEAS